MQKIVISGSAKLQDRINYWLEHFQNQGYEVLDYPKPIHPDDLKATLPTVYKNFYTHLENADVFFLMNEDKNGIKGYIGAGAIAELTYAVIQNLIHHKNIEIFILNLPSAEVPAHDEIKFWLDVGWIKLYPQE